MEASGAKARGLDRADEVTALDATFLELEQADESAHMHIGGVMIFEAPEGRRAPSVERVRAETEARLGELPRYRRRLSTPHTGGFHWPRWEEDEDFDVARHVYRAALPEPRDEAELLGWAGAYFSQRLDRSRPLWEMVLINLAGHRWALVTKTHHCMVDGVGSVELGHTLLDTSPDDLPHAHGRRRTPPPRGAAPMPRPAAPLPLRLGARALTASRGAAGAAVRTAGAAAWLVAGSLGTPSRAPRQARDALARSRALVELLVKDELISAPHTSLNEPIGTRRRLAVFTVPLAELKQIKQGLGGTVNDVVLAAAAGGLRELLLARGEPLPGQGLRAMVPVNVRSAGERLALGNKVTSLFVHLPVAEGEALARYRRQVGDAEGQKSGSQAVGSQTMIGLAGHAPPVLHSFLAQALFATRLFNVTVTNVPGPREPLYAFGSRMLGVWPLVPLAARHAVGLAVLSYDGNLFFCLNADRDSMRDLDVLADGIHGSIDELLHLAGANSGTAERSPRLESVINAD